MAGVKAELEDLAFKFLEPEDYSALSRQVRAKKTQRERTIERVRAPLAEELARAELTGFEITGRPKNLWSIYKKMKKRGKPFEEIYDLLAVRVLVSSIPECYHVLGMIHHKWTPLQERIKDYIASPKSNGYQSLHTTVFGPAGSCTRSRSARARCTAPRSTASPPTGSTMSARARRAGPPPRLVPAAHRAAAGRAHPEEFLEFLKIDLYQDEIFVFTPRAT